MVAAMKMRFFKTRGSEGNGQQASDEIRIANVHLNFRTAKRELKGGGEAYRHFWDTLATYLVKFGPRYMTGDFNMALFAVVPELRARGFQSNLGVSYCWKNEHE